MKAFSDDYYTIASETKEEAIKFYLEQELGDEEYIEELEEVDIDKKKMLFPLDELPEEYHDEEKYPRSDWNGLYTGVEISLREAMKYRKEKPPYIISVSSDAV